METGTVESSRIWKEAEAAGIGRFRANCGSPEREVAADKRAAESAGNGSIGGSGKRAIEMVGNDARGDRADQRGRTSVDRRHFTLEIYGG